MRELPLEELPGATLRFVDDLPETLDGAVRVGPYSVARPGALLRVVPGVGRFLAHDGEAIDVFVEPGADDAAVDALAHGGVLGALMHQRGDLPFHASTLVAPDGRFSVALCGESGAGKSTTAFALLRRGWTMLSDDLTRVTIEDGRPIAWPGRTTLRLMRDACERFGIDPATCAPAPNWPDKFIVTLPRHDAPLPLSAMVVLSNGAASPSPDPQTLTGFAALSAVTAQTYRLHYVAALGRAESHFRAVAAVASHVRVVALRRAPVEEIATAVRHLTD